ncbi:MAG: tetratricopeptide repeat protein, partial [Bradymonadaceae bacterium]
MHRFNAPLLIALLVSLFAHDLTAQEKPTDDKIRTAGGEARFRVIQRFGNEPQSSIVPTVSASSPFAPIIDAVQAEDWARAHGLLSRATLAGDVAKEADKTFLAAYVALQAGHYEHARALFEGLKGKLPVLDDYVQHYGAASAHGAAKYHEAAMFSSRVPEESLLYPASLIQLADSLLAAGTEDDVDRAVEIFDLYLKLYPNRRDTATVRMRLGETLEGRGAGEDAAKHYIQVWNAHPLSANATRAHQKLNALRPNLSEATVARFDTVTRERQMRRFNALFDLHRSETLIEELPKAFATWEKGSPERCEGTFLVGRSHTKLRRHADGGEWYERVLTECKGSDFEIRALYLGGRGYWNAGQRERAKALFKRIWTEYPDHSFADDAMYFTARILRDENKNEEASKLLREQVKRYPKDDMAKDAHWLLVREMFEKKNHKGVVAYVDGLKETGEDDIYSQGRLHYFKARALELDGNRSGADAAFGEVITTYPKTYYAFLAFNRLATLSGTADLPTDVCTLEIELCQALSFQADEPTPIEIPA